MFWILFIYGFFPLDAFPGSRAGGLHLFGNSSIWTIILGIVKKALGTSAQGIDRHMHGSLGYTGFILGIRTDDDGQLNINHMILSAIILLFVICFLVWCDDSVRCLGHKLHVTHVLDLQYPEGGGELS